MIGNCGWGVSTAKDAKVGTMLAKWLTYLRTSGVRMCVCPLTRWYYTRIWGMDIGEGTRISLSAKVDLTNPSGVTIGKYTAISFRSSILTHDFVHGAHRKTRIGSYCFIGAGSIIMPGVTIGDNCVIGAGAVVMRNVPAGSVVIGNPGRIVEGEIITGKFGTMTARKEAA